MRHPVQAADAIALMSGSRARALLSRASMPQFTGPSRVVRGEEPVPAVAEIVERLRLLGTSTSPRDQNAPWAPVPLMSRPGPSPEPAHSPDPAQTTQSEETSEARLLSLMLEVGVPDTLAASLTDTALACAKVEVEPDASPDESAPASLASARDMLSTIETLSQLSTQLDAVMITATGRLTMETGKLLLADKSLTDPADLSQTARDRWRARMKSLARHEIEAALGWGEGEVIDLVGLASSPSAVTRPVSGALMRGEACRKLARRYFRACSTLAHEDAAAIATALFGDDPVTAVTERLTSDGDWTGEPWHHKEFNRALDREVAKVKARDPESQAKSRKAAKNRADVRVNLDDDGGAEVMIGCLTLQGAAIADRIEYAARAIRKAGDPRTLAQLRSAVATALLLHGTVDLGGLSDDPGTITVEQSAQLAKVLHGLPTADLNVIVPFTMLAGASVPTCACHGSGAPPGDPPDNQSLHDQRPPGQTPHDTHPPGEPPDDQHQQDHYPADTGVAEVVGRHSAFLATREVRELMLTPGSVLHRLVTDPTTGRCLERSTTAYRFTAAQREQIIAADRFCRAPGCLHPGPLCQVDHVQEHGTPGGETCEANGQLAHEAHHDLKTKKAWQATINEAREVTWTTLLGRIYRTKAHDYRQYTALLRSAIEAVDDDLVRSDGGDPSDNRAAAIDRAIYSALSYRPAGGSLEAVDDWDESDRQFLGWGRISLTYENAQGRRRYGPHPDRVTSERRRHDSTKDPSPTDGSAEAEAASSSEASPTESAPTEEAPTEASSTSPPGKPLRIDPGLYERAPRLDDPALLDGSPVTPPPDDYGRYARGQSWFADDDDPPPF